MPLPQVEKIVRCRFLEIPGQVWLILFALFGGDGCVELVAEILLGLACFFCISTQMGYQASVVIELRGICDLAGFLGLQGFELALQLLVFLLLDAELGIEEGCPNGG